MRRFGATFLVFCFFSSLPHLYALASENKKTPHTSLPSMGELSGYIEKTRRLHGTRMFVDVTGQFRTSFSTSRVAYGNVVQVLNLNGGNFSGIDFENCNLAMASMQNTTFQNANFRGANLSHVDFEAADLTNADFSGADLGNAHLFKAILTGTKFTGANLFNANFDRARGIDKKDLKKLSQKAAIFRQVQRLPLAPVK